MSTKSTTSIHMLFSSFSFDIFSKCLVRLTQSSLHVAHNVEFAEQFWKSGSTDDGFQFTLTKRNVIICHNQVKKEQKWVKAYFSEVINANLELLLMSIELFDERLQSEIDRIVDHIVRKKAIFIMEITNMKRNVLINIAVIYINHRIWT